MSRSLLHNLNRLVRARAELAEADTELVRAKTRADSELGQSLGAFARALEAFLPHVLRRYCPEAHTPGGAPAGAPEAAAGVGAPSTGTET